MQSVSLEDEENDPRQQVVGSPKSHGAGPAPDNQPAKPIFDIQVGDPHKVGDLTSAHTVYQVRTKVGGSSLCRHSEA
jgi:sorting nexin-1/2